jgi:predicted dehydrogenase
MQQLLDDPAVDVVAICSPHQFHADQVAAAAAAGKRAVLCEKPLATTVAQAQRIADVSASSGMPVVVGAMHAYDPAWTAAQRHWGALPESTSLVRSVIYLPPNDEFVQLATDPVAAPGIPAAPSGSAQPTTEWRAERIRATVLGLVTHTIPQVRQFLPTLTDVRAARVLAPFGYHLVLGSGDRTAELIALMPGRWALAWTFDAWGLEGQLHLDWPPSYVLAGSATARLSRAEGDRQWRFPTNGYQAEWMHLADVAEGKAELAIPAQEAVDDLLFALNLIDLAMPLVRENP